MDDGVDKHELFDIARAHNVEAIVYYQLSDNIKELYEPALAQIYRYVQTCGVVQELQNSLIGIPHIWVKGVVVSELYPQKQFRSMGDIDLLIKEEDREKIDKLLIDNKYDVLLKENETFVYSKKSVIIEVHTGLIHPRSGNTMIVNYFKRVWEFQKNGQLTWEFHIVYLIVHLREHIMDRGVGIRQFLDIALVENSQEMDWTWIETELNKINMLEFAEMCFSFIEMWFGIKTHLKRINIAQETYNEVTEEIVSGGVFGNPLNSSDDSKEIMNIMKNKKEPMFFARIEYWLTQTFPPFEVMVKLPYCKYMKNRKYLLPISWVHRSIVRLFNRDYRKRYVRRVSISKQQLEKRKDYYEIWKI